MSTEPPSSASEQPIEGPVSRTESLLRELGPKIGCAALAVLTPSGAVHRLWARSRTSFEFGREQLASLGSMLTSRCIGNGETLVSPRVRATADGPVLAQLIAIPVGIEGQQPAAMVAALWRPEDPAPEQKARGRLRRLAETLAQRIPPEKDNATGILTWQGFCRRLDQIIAARGENADVAVLYGNIDQLHAFNKLKGMAAGDQAIVLASQAIRCSIDGFEYAACRLSGDRFVVALPGSSIEKARELGGQIRTTFESAVQATFGAGTTLSISLGAALGHLGRADFDRALTDAETACRAAKDRGRNRIVAFEPSDLSMVRRHDDIGAMRLLRDAIDSDRLVIFAQPIMPLLNLDLPTSYEFLVRILRQDGSIAEPAEFMSAAARYQMLPLLDRAVIMQAFAQMRTAVPGRDSLPFAFSINLSAATLCEPSFHEWMVEQIERYAIPGSQLKIEITESSSTSNLEQMQTTMAKFARIGVGFAIDDFGTGINSLSHIKALDVGTLKLDGSYVRDVLENTRSQALVRAIVQLAESMGIVTVAEYVDSVALRTRVAELGVHFAQGFAVGRPEPLSDLLANNVTVPALRSA